MNRPCPDRASEASVSPFGFLVGRKPNRRGEGIRRIEAVRSPTFTVRALSPAELPLLKERPSQPLKGCKLLGHSADTFDQPSNTRLRPQFFIGRKVGHFQMLRDGVQHLEGFG